MKLNTFSLAISVFLLVVGNIIQNIYIFNLGVGTFAVAGVEAILDEREDYKLHQEILIQRLKKK